MSNVVQFKQRLAGPPKPSEAYLTIRALQDKQQADLNKVGESVKRLQFLLAQFKLNRDGEK